jgi:hypothetical protein
MLMDMCSKVFSHIGHGTLESKTECVFSPPLSSSSAWRRPTSRHAQSNKHPGEHNEHTPHTVACIVAQHTPQNQVPTIPVLSQSPPIASFPIGCCVIVASSHPQHVNTYGAVIRHTAKFVIFAPEICSRGESICILPAEQPTTCRPLRP